MYDEIVAQVGTPPDTAVYTYGDTIYFPKGGELPEDLWRHEEKHGEQQDKMGAREWWDHWLASIEFRVWQELEAYQVQYRFLKTTHRDRNAQARLAFLLAQELSSPMYGQVITFQEAYRRIRE